MSSKMNAAWLLATMMMATATGDNLYGNTSPDTRDTRKCSQCKHGKKSFCKMVNHHITKNTPVNYCKHFEI